MDEKIVIEAMDSRFDGIDKFDVVDELLGLEAENRRLKEELNQREIERNQNTYRRVLRENQDLRAKNP